jgi:hypothetical protein
LPIEEESTAHSARWLVYRIVAASVRLQSHINVSYSDVTDDIKNSNCARTVRWSDGVDGSIGRLTLDQFESAATKADQDTARGSA